MGNIVVNVGLNLSLLDLITAPLTGATAHLYTNNYTPIATSVVGDFTELTGSGYGPITLSGWSTPALGGDGYYTTGTAPIAWTNSGGTSWPTAYGWYYLDSTGTIVLSAGLFASPITVPSGGNLPLLPLFALGSEYPIPPVVIAQMTPLISYPDAGVPPNSISPSTNSTGAVDLRLHPSVMWTLYVGTLGSSATIDAKLQQSANGITGWTDVTGSSITTVTAADKIVTLEINLAGVASGQHFARLSYTVGTAASVISVVVQVADSSADVAAVVQRLNLCM